MPTLHRQPHPSKQRATSEPPRHPCRLTETSHVEASDPPPTLSVETRNADLTEYRDEKSKQAAHRPATRHGERATSDKPDRTARRHDRHRPAPRPARRQAKRGEGMTPEEQRERAEGKRHGRGRSGPRSFRAKKKRRGEVLFLIPVLSSVLQAAFRRLSSRPSFRQRRCEARGGGVSPLACSWERPCVMRLVGAIRRAGMGICGIG